LFANNAVQDFIRKIFVFFKISLIEASIIDFNSYKWNSIDCFIISSLKMKFLAILGVILLSVNISSTLITPTPDVCVDGNCGSECVGEGCSDEGCCDGDNCCDSDSC
jgi:hypothetical protein